MQVKNNNNLNNNNLFTSIAAYGFTSYPRRRSNVSEASCLRTQRHAPART